MSTVTPRRPRGNARARQDRRPAGHQRPAPPSAHMATGEHAQAATGHFDRPPHRILVIELLMGVYGIGIERMRRGEAT